MKKKKTSIPLVLISIILSMLCLSYASVPLYRIFCKATGFGGLPRKKTSFFENNTGKSKIKVRFSAATNGLPLSFSPNQHHITLAPGQQKLAFYTATNTSDTIISGTAVYNVSPPQAGKYFFKIACFCFTEQIFEPHKSVIMPVSFTIDPGIETDTSTMHIREITLSYTFFPSTKVPTTQLEQNSVQ
ncbi:MAG: cytochrome c oxidase assembly protein [Aaplasma endosymbiont of Hyalomma asiaticum]